MEGFETLQRMYRSSLPMKAAALEAEWNAILAGEPPGPHAEALRSQLHQLCGSAGAYGFDDMGEMARELEKSWVRWLQVPAPQRSDAFGLCMELAPRMHALQTALRTAALPAEDAG